MRALVALAFAVTVGACLSDPGPQFDVVPCVGKDGMCQRACNSQAAMEPWTGPACSNAFTYFRGEKHWPDTCSQTFEWNDISGCCARLTIGHDMGDADDYFFQCD